MIQSLAQSEFCKEGGSYDSTISQWEVLDLNGRSAMKRDLMIQFFAKGKFCQEVVSYDSKFCQG